MVTTEIQLTEKQSRALAKLSAEEGMSVAELIQKSINRYIDEPDRVITDEQWERAFAIVGKYNSGVPDLGTNHDKYLAEIYEEDLE
jgi:hypothetical protein